MGKDRSVVASLAILKVNFEVLGRDYIENFVPFVAECLRTSADDVVSLPALQSALRDAFGLSLPLNPLRQILQRAAKAGFVRRESGVFYRIPEACSQSNVALTSARVRSDVDGLVSALRTYAKDAFHVDWTDEHAEGALLGFVGDSGLDVLFATTTNAVLPTPDKSREGAFVVGDFASAVRKSQPTLFETLETLIRGALLANALYLPDIGKAAKRFKATKVYLDSTLTIFALGYAGTDRQGPCLELVDLLKRYGAKLCCFDCTVSEIRGILDACAARLRRGQLRDAYGPTIDYFISQGLTSTDVDLLAVQLPEALARAGLSIEAKPSFSEHAYVIDEKGFEEHIQGIIGYGNPRAREHDVACVSAVARIRRGRESYEVETCRALFVTTNNELARATRKFFQANASPGSVALCISDYALGNLLWLKGPTDAPDLPKMRLIADAYAAMEPSDQLWRSYLLEIAKLEARGSVSADDYLLLRHSVAAKAALMHLTKGEQTAFSEGTVSEILEMAKRNLRADLEVQICEERTGRLAAEKELSAREAARARRVERVEERARQMAKWLSVALLGALAVGLALASIYTFPWELPKIRHEFLRYALTIGQVGLLAYGVTNMIWGTTIRGLTHRLQLRLKVPILSLLRRIAGDDQDDGAT